MKKIYLAILTVLLAISASAAVYASTVDVRVDGVPVDASAHIAYGVTMIVADKLSAILGVELDMNGLVPIRSTAEGLGFGVGFVDGVVTITTPEHPLLGDWNLSWGGYIVFNIDGTGFFDETWSGIRPFTWSDNGLYLHLSFGDSHNYLSVFQVRGHNLTIISINPDSFGEITRARRVFATDPRLTNSIWIAEDDERYELFFSWDNWGDRGIWNYSLEDFEWWVEGEYLHISVWGSGEVELWAYHFDGDALIMKQGEVERRFYPQSSLWGDWDSDWDDNSADFMGTWFVSDNYGNFYIFDRWNMGTRGQNGFVLEVFDWFIDGDYLVLEVATGFGWDDYVLEHWAFELEEGIIRLNRQGGYDEQKILLSAYMGEMFDPDLIGEWVLEHEPENIIIFDYLGIGARGLYINGDIDETELEIFGWQTDGAYLHTLIWGWLGHEERQESFTYELTLEGEERVLILTGTYTDAVPQRFIEHRWW